MHELLWSMFEQNHEVICDLNIRLAFVFGGALWGKERCEKLGWSQVISSLESRELGLHWVTGVESSNVSQKQNNKWTWIPRLFSSFLLDFAFVSISISKASQGQHQAHALPFRFTPPVAFPILFMGITICSGQSSWRSWGHPHFLFISYSMVSKIAYANDSFCDLAL